MPSAGGTDDAPARPGALRLVARGAASRCAYCLEVLAPTRRAACGCGAAYHADCWAELARCATLGCEGRPTAADRARAGTCPGCHRDLRGAFRWERGACGGCGAVYHLGCRAGRARCATPGCAAGRHDLWAGAAPPPPVAGPGLGQTLAALAARAFGPTDAARAAASRAATRAARRAALHALADEARRART